MKKVNCKDKGKNSDHANLNGQYEEKEVTMVINAYAIEYPRTVVIMPRHTPTTPATVFAPHWATYHTRSAKVCVVILP